MKRSVRRLAPALTLALIAAISAAGCGMIMMSSSHDVPGCTHPNDEDAILDEYQKDPVFSIKPPHAQPYGGRHVEKACRQLNFEDATSTSVTQYYSLTQPYDSGDLHTVYDTAVKANGWIPAPGPQGVLVRYLYCKRIRGMQSELGLSASSGTQSTRKGDVTVSVLAVSVTAAANDPTCDPDSVAPSKKPTRPLLEPVSQATDTSARCHVPRPDGRDCGGSPPQNQAGRL